MGKGRSLHSVLSHLFERFNAMPPDDDVIAEVGGLVDETRVTLGVYGPDLNPEDVSELLWCLPTRSHRRGETAGRRSPPFKGGAWLLSFEGKAPVGPEELLIQMLERLPSSAERWVQVRERYSVRITVAIFFEGWNRGFGFSPASVARLAELGVPVEFDIYADGEDEPTP